MYATCGWCHRLLKVKGNYDNRQHTIYCSPGCQAADWMFRAWQSDEEINRRRHYDELTKGEES